MTIIGVVLAGGKSSRYGKPKMFETYKGKQFYEHSVDALKDNSLAPIIISTNDQLSPSFQRDDILLILEEQPHQGPLYAIYQVMSQVPDAEWFFVLSCDIPFVTSTFVSKMIGYVDSDQYDAIVPIQSGRLQPLLALYHRRNVKRIEQLLVEKQRKIRLLLDDVRTLTVPFPADDKVFTNMNYQEDWLDHN
ncbi:molybdenum cofactor guanylyltransferase [Bacillus fonticola]|uniref:molybdenum cofactor guanylyltransferase n=1 Tax=Bacillus fonticola TaxID=2728853 RepID=UPI0014749FB8|nr:molybdenum cofactor guanylyltransferase [Bacillus fonticola]